jgi:hypothetical protein
VQTFDDGKLTAALLLKDAKGRYLRTQSPAVLQHDDSGENFDPSVFSEAAAYGRPAFDERWYILPLDESATTAGLYGIESDAIGRSFLRQNGLRAEVQSFFERDVKTSLPQNRFVGGNDQALQWQIHPVTGDDD